MTKRQIKKSCLLFGEGKREKIFFRFLESTKEFENKHYKNWSIMQDNASGGSCRTVLEACIKVISDRDYDLVLCFIDLDKLSCDFPSNKKYKEEKEKIEELARKNKINIIWQNKNHEDELSRITGGKIKDKNHMQKKIKKYEHLIIKSDFVKGIFMYFQ